VSNIVDREREQHRRGLRAWRLDLDHRL